jgi:hypothetical protein
MEGLGGGRVVAPAFGDVQVTGVLDGRDDRGADGGQVGWPAAGPASGGIFAESDIPDMMVRLDGPVLADQPAQVLRGGVRAGQAGDGVGGLAGDLAGSGVLPPAGDLDGLAGMREIQAADVGGLHGPGLGAAVPGLPGDAAGRHLPPGQRPDPGMQQRLVAFHQEGDRLRRFRAGLPCEVVVTSVTHPLHGCRLRAYAVRLAAWLLLSGFHGGGVSAGLPGHGMTDARVACWVTIAVLAALPFPFRSFSGRRMR